MHYDQQLEEKRLGLTQMWRAAGLDERVIENLQIESVGQAGLRDRVDMTLHRVDGQMRLGLYDLERSEIIDLKRCPQMSQAIEPWFADFRANLPDLELGAARLRVSPTGERGLWLHFPNTEIQRFLKEQTWLRAMMSHAHVEMGQRRELVVEDGDQLALRPPILKPWFETYIGDESQPISLYCTVGSFTQPGYRANRKLVTMVRDMARKSGEMNWLELGSGIGNFTLPLASLGGRVLAIENDRRACEGLARSAKEADLDGSIQIEVRNMHRSDQDLGELLTGVDAILADPPRSGLRAFAQLLAERPTQQRPPLMIYVSCFAESLIQDLSVLCRAGYKPIEVKGLDQFPQSKHCEWITLLGV